MPIPNGFRKSKQPTRKQAERQTKVQDFLKAYGEICEKHNLKLDVYFNYNPRGQEAVLDVTYIKPPEVPLDIRKEEDKVKIKAMTDPFLKEYDDMCYEHKMRFVAVCELNDKGIFPKIKFEDFEPKPAFEIKDLPPKEGEQTA